ncbi:DUF1559 domain-containing protein [Blastopirellula sp. JC732]|uniref:DUF1559 domain-containing protein n=1 Tax=Blastopirellula sediminis TaxID=2894196 RepID=A0A9X1SG34_9BACT|nr:DUF1559 domain-containing protein [Blastopirellula sediminis]MCC9609734.1 DUF1559 domain-containing protein [Blastopirellula sediminis]MCC9628978.1 DUF1559 domain-containing protein [Blastopirellula sediminis]
MRKPAHLPQSRQGQSNATAVIALVLVVLLLIGGVFVLWLMPAVADARAAATTSASSGHLKVIGLALHNYHDTYGELPPAYIADENGKPIHSWRVLILPFIEYGDLYDRYDFDEPWDAPNNRLLMQERPVVYADPRNPGEDPKTTPYQAIAGPGTCFDPTVAKMKLAEITDGTAVTAMVVENFGKPVIWTEPDDISPQEFLSGLPLQAAPGGKVWVMNADTSSKLINHSELGAAPSWTTRDAGD